MTLAAIVPERKVGPRFKVIAANLVIFITYYDESSSSLMNDDGGMVMTKV